MSLEGARVAFRTRGKAKHLLVQRQIRKADDRQVPVQIELSAGCSQRTIVVEAVRAVTVLAEAASYAFIFFHKTNSPGQEAKWPGRAIRPNTLN